MAVKALYRAMHSTATLAKMRVFAPMFFLEGMIDARRCAYTNILAARRVQSFHF
jgi:hypothetical protein